MANGFDAALQSLLEGKEIQPVIAMSVYSLAQYRITNQLTPEMFVCLRLKGVHVVEQKRIGIWQDDDKNTFAQNNEAEDRYILTSLVPKDERPVDHAAKHTYLECVNHACNYGLEPESLAHILLNKFPTVVWACTARCDEELFGHCGTHMQVQGPMYMGQECLACVIAREADSADIGI